MPIHAGIRMALVYISMTILRPTSLPRLVPHTHPLACGTLHLHVRLGIALDMTKEEPKAASRGLRGFERDASKRVHSLQPGQMQRPRDSQKNLYAPTLTNNLLDMPVDTVLEVSAMIREIHATYLLRSRASQIPCTNGTWVLGTSNMQLYLPEKHGFHI